MTTPNPNLNPEGRPSTPFDFTAKEFLDAMESRIAEGVTLLFPRVKQACVLFLEDPSASDLDDNVRNDLVALYNLADGILSVQNANNPMPGDDANGRRAERFSEEALRKFQLRDGRMRARARAGRQGGSVAGQLERQIGQGAVTQEELQVLLGDDELISLSQWMSALPDAFMYLSRTKQEAGREV